MRVVPVLDIKNGRAVHARGGDRSLYAPLRSPFYPSSDPFAAARAMRDRLGVDELYIADLDAIESGSRANRSLIQSLVADGFKLWLDRGIREPNDVDDPILDDLFRVIAGAETIQGAETIATLVRRRGEGSVVMSLDLDPQGVRLSRTLRSNDFDDSPLAMIETAYQAGCRTFLILDLASVGGESGFRRLELVDELRRRRPGVSIAIGGGIRGIDDLVLAASRGASVALVGTAVHHGLVDREAVTLVESIDK